MGARGPAPAPTALKLLRGDHPERVNRNEPKPLDVPLVKPEWLTPDAAELWDRLVPHLGAMGTAKQCDQELLVAYCECWSRFRRIQELVNRSQPLHKGREDTLVKNPLWTQLIRDVTTELRVLGREFGFTPSARTGLRVEISTSDAGRLFTTG